MTEDLNYIENALRELSFYVHACITKQEKEKFRRQFYLVGGKNDPAVQDDVALKLNKEKASKRLTFTKKELTIMPQKIRNVFACKDYVIYYRTKPSGVHEARLRCDGYNISVSSKNLAVLKDKFIQEFTRQSGELSPKEELPPQNPAETVLFNDCLSSWLKIKERTTKPTTYRGYCQSAELYLFYKFEGRTLASITRSELQDYLFSFVDAGKYRTAEKVQLILRCVFDLACDDYNLPSPMRKIELPFRESKKGSALTLSEERTLVDFCLNNLDRPASHALLVLIYFGLRRSELATLTVEGESLTCLTSKLRKGRNEVARSIPFTPVFKRVARHVDFKLAKTVNVNTLNTTLKRLLPNHHLHELRYTFITRCKECGVNPEIVMLWDGHEEDKDVRSSKIDRGYTDYSPEYQLKQAKLVDYDLPF